MTWQKDRCHLCKWKKHFAKHPEWIPIQATETLNSKRPWRFCHWFSDARYVIVSTNYSQTILLRYCDICNGRCVCWELEGSVVPDFDTSSSREQLFEDIFEMHLARQSNNFFQLNYVMNIDCITHSLTHSRPKLYFVYLWKLINCTALERLYKHFSWGIFGANSFCKIS